MLQNIEGMMSEKGWLCIVMVCSLSLMSIEAYEVGLTFLESAVAKGAGKLASFFL